MMGICEVTLILVLIGLAFSVYFFYDSVKRYRKTVLRLERHLERENLARYRCLEQLENEVQHKVKE